MSGKKIVLFFWRESTRRLFILIFCTVTINMHLENTAPDF